MTKTQEQCKDKKKETAKHEIIKKILKIIRKKLIEVIIEKCVTIPIIQKSFINILKTLLQKL